MGKRLIIQRRGKASPVHSSPSHQHKGPVTHPKVQGTATGTIVDIIHDPGHTAPIARVQFPEGPIQHLLAPEGARVGGLIKTGTDELEPGNVLPLKRIPEGTPIYNIESQPGDGGKFVRTAGTSALLVGRTEAHVTVRLPSGAFKQLNPNCKAVIGVVAGGGRGDKPIAKAGKAHHKYKASGRLWPRVRGVAKNPVDHPHGGGNAHRKEGKPTTVARGTPAGRNVGHIAAKRTGLRKG
ncbi:MAG TPA: 50S ribosomal protein L2 [Candidatus Thermoplasmatota archaeon]|nr:50S ribosomal protein L2 [Candidatus Thermoplasmatota archaeon]